jgi:hypothetical protein
MRRGIGFQCDKLVVVQFRNAALICAVISEGAPIQDDRRRALG